MLPNQITKSRPTTTTTNGHFTRYPLLLPTLVQQADCGGTDGEGSSDPFYAWGALSGLIGILESEASHKTLV